MEPIDIFLYTFLIYGAVDLIKMGLIRFRIIKPSRFTVAHVLAAVGAGRFQLSHEQTLLIMGLIIKNQDHGHCFTSSFLKFLEKEGQITISEKLKDHLNDN